MTAEDAPAPIRVSAVVLKDESGRVLMVRKRGTVRFMLPGGKPEPGESAAQTAVRECYEELGLVLDPQALSPLGVYTAPAANEPGRDVEGTVFTHPFAGPGHPAAEIEELRWIGPAGWDGDDLAPLSRIILPSMPVHG